jgi:AcrR family transcriptional regulator
MTSSTARRGRGRPVTAPATRRAIRDTAVALMHRKGYAGMSIQQLADALAFSKPAFYYHVKNKADLLLQISLETLDLAHQRISASALSDASPAEKMERIIRAYVELMTERPALFAVYFAEKSHLDASNLERMRAAERQLLHLVEGVYREGVSSGEFRDLNPTVSVFGILGMCFWVYQWYRSDGEQRANDIADVLLELASHGYLASPEVSARGRRRRSSTGSQPMAG